MSTTATEFSVKSFLTTYLQRIGGMYANDFSFIPADLQTASPMGAARPASEFTAECASFNRFVAAQVRGEEPVRRTDEERRAYFASFDTGQKAIDALTDSVAELVSAVEKASEEDLHRKIAMPWGEESPLVAAVHMAAVHMSYHDGQVNYIQALHGDKENHW